MTISRSLLLALFVSLFFQTGCASYFKRKECESTNWFKHGEKVALSGSRLTGDRLVGECIDVEANINDAALDKGFKKGMEQYCIPAQAFATGKSGTAFSPDMCDGENLSVLLAKHAAGVAEYCEKSNGFSVGAKGKPYNGICPKALEAGFLPEFNRGRKSYLVVLLNENERKISDLDREISDLESDAHRKSWEAQQALVPQLVSESVYDHETNRYRDQQVWKVTFAQQSEADSIKWQVQGIHSDIANKRSEQSKIRQRNAKIRLESVELDRNGAG